LKEKLEAALSKWSICIFLFIPSDIVFEN
jgi:hypothetical protein